MYKRRKSTRFERAWWSVAGLCGSVVLACASAGVEPEPGSDAGSYYDAFCTKHCMNVPAACADATADEKSACLQMCLEKTKNELVNCTDSCAVVGWSYDKCVCHESGCRWEEHVSPDYHGDWLMLCSAPDTYQCHGFVVMVDYHGFGLGCEWLNCHP